MQTNQTTSDDQSVQALNDELADLIEEAKQVNQEIDESSAENAKAMDEIEGQVDASVQKVDELCAELDEAEKEAGDELEALVLQRAKELDNEDATE